MKRSHLPAGISRNRPSGHRRVTFSAGREEVEAIGYVPQKPGDEKPPHDPDTPPDSVDPAGICPRCGRFSNFDVTKEPIPLLYLGDAVMEDMYGGKDRLVQERVTVFECLGCHERTAVIEELTIGNKPSGGKFRGGRDDALPWRQLVATRVRRVVDASVPDRVRGIFGEGLRCLSAKAPNAAAVMFGRTLEAIVHDKGGEKAVKALDRSLAAALDVMVAEGRLSQDLADWAKEVRLGRNAGGHDEPLDKLDDSIPMASLRPSSSRSRIPSRLRSRPD